jgi:hypothetical protein
MQLKFRKRECADSILIFCVVTFVLHFAWEWYQCRPFFIHRGSPESLFSMMVASIGDVVLTLLIVCSVFVVNKMSPLPRSKLLSARGVSLMEFFAVFVAVAVEKYALATGRWQYTAINPIIPFMRVSLLPVAQLMILTPVSVYLTGVMTRPHSS